MLYLARSRAGHGRHLHRRTELLVERQRDRADHLRVVGLAYGAASVLGLQSELDLDCAHQALADRSQPVGVRLVRGGRGSLRTLEVVADRPVASRLGRTHRALNPRVQRRPHGRVAGDGRLRSDDLVPQPLQLGARQRLPRRCRRRRQRRGGTEALARRVGQRAQRTQSAGVRDELVAAVGVRHADDARAERVDLLTQLDHRVATDQGEGLCGVASSIALAHHDIDGVHHDAAGVLPHVPDRLACAYDTRRRVPLRLPREIEGPHRLLIRRHGHVSSALRCGAGRS